MPVWLEVRNRPSYYNFHICSTLNKVSAETTHSNLRGEHDIHFARAKFFISGNYPAKIDRFVSNPKHFQGYGYGLKTNSPYMNKINEKILRIFNAGLLSKWIDDAMNEYRTHKKAVIEDQVSRGKKVNERKTGQKYLRVNC